MTPAVREFVTFIGDERRRALVTRVLDAFDSAVLPCNSWLPRAVIMGDFNGMCGNQHFLAFIASCYYLALCGALLGA